MTTITHILRMGTRWRILVACSHHFTVSSDDYRRRQLYVGRRVTCETCASLARSA